MKYLSPHGVLDFRTGHRAPAVHFLLLALFILVIGFAIQNSVRLLANHFIDGDAPREMASLYPITDYRATVPPVLPQQDTQADSNATLSDVEKGAEAWRYGTGLQTGVLPPDQTQSPIRSEI